ncbi:unnamed protein product [Ranitomeya imitator]|uniref:Uncharacterized protein n=1 Tax=Ranitomeya imitator TaxID=111125 RepID=A0ABN9L8D2_9NEOB|nr:unnamed protein product [Ranitomeya imitator]
MLLHLRDLTSCKKLNWESSVSDLRVLGVSGDESVLHFMHMLSMTGSVASRGSRSSGSTRSDGGRGVQKEDRSGGGETPSLAQVVSRILHPEQPEEKWRSGPPQ